METGVEWNIGIFSMMTIIVGVIGIMLGVRFLHLDKEYKNLTIKYQKEIEDLHEKREEIKSKTIEKAESDTYNFITVLFVLNYKLAECKIKRKENRQIGTALDLLCISIIIVLGLAATLGIFKGDAALLLLAMILGLLFAAPVLHFYLNYRFINAQRLF